MAKLILIRHGKSEWNLKGLWTGWTDIPLAPEGVKEAQETAVLLRHIPIQVVFTSKLIRAKQTWEAVSEALGYQDLPVTEAAELNEKNYGDFTGKNKWDVKKEVGDEEFQKIRRSWDYQIPGGESLKDVYDRVVPYYQKTILPLLEEGKNVIVAAHGNSLRALVKYLENIPDESISELEIPTGTAYVYDLDQEGKITHKEIFGATENTV